MSGIAGIILGVLALLMLGVLVLFSIHVIGEEIYGHGFEERGDEDYDNE